MPSALAQSFRNQVRQQIALFSFSQLASEIMQLMRSDLAFRGPSGSEFQLLLQQKEKDRLGSSSDFEPLGTA